MNSEARAISATPAKRSLSQYSTALTSWLVTRSIAKGEEIKQDVSTLENPAILEQLKQTM